MLLPVLRYTDLNDAIERANASPLGSPPQCGRQIKREASRSSKDWMPASTIGRMSH